MLSDVEVTPEQLMATLRKAAQGAILAELVEVATYHRVHELAAKATEEMETIRAKVGDSSPSAEQRGRLARLQRLIDVLTEIPAPHLTYLPALWLATGPPAARRFQILGAEDTL